MPQSKQSKAVIISLKNRSLSLKNPENRKKFEQLLMDANNKNNRNKRPEDRRDKIIPIDKEIRKFGVTILDNDRSRESVRKKIEQLKSIEKVKQKKTPLPDLFG